MAVTAEPRYPIRRYPFPVRHSGLMRFFSGKGRIALQTAVGVAVLLALRFAVDEAEWQFITPGPLLSAVVSGGIFVVALVIAGTLTDYKESERMPAEIVAALSSILTDARAFKQEKPDLDLERLRARLGAVVTTFKSDMMDPSRRDCLDAVDELSQSFAEMDRLEVLTTYVSRLRGEQATVRKAVLRAYHIQHTEFVPSSYVLIWTIMLVALIVLTFIESESSTEAYVLIGAIDFFLLYLVRLLGVLDKPFRPEKETCDDVDLQLLDQFETAMRQGSAG